MQLSIPHKFAFLCLPKCGSTSVEKALRKHISFRIGGHPSLKHINAKMFEKHIRPLLRKVDPDRRIETFCIMREPVDRVRSWYEYQKRPELKDPSHRAHHRYNGHITYAEFVELYLSGDGPKFSRIGTQAGFIRLGDGSIGIDRIFRLDRMDQVADYLSTKTGGTIEIKRENKSVPVARIGLFRKAPAVDSENRSRELELPAPLLERLRQHLADDYEIYNRLPND